MERNRSATQGAELIWGCFSIHLIEKASMPLSADCPGCLLASYRPSSWPVRRGPSLSLPLFYITVCFLCPPPSSYSVTYFLAPSSHFWFVFLCPSLTLLVPVSCDPLFHLTYFMWCCTRPSPCFILSVATSLSGLPLDLA